MFVINIAEGIMAALAIVGGAFIHCSVFYKYLDSTPIGRVILLGLFVEVATAMLLVGKGMVTENA